MKKVTLVSAVLAALCATPAMAAQVEMYGLLDTGVKVQKIGEGDTTFSMESGQRSGSRVGVRGNEKINDTLEVGFVLEHGLDTDTGADIREQISDLRALLDGYRTGELPEHAGARA